MVFLDTGLVEDGVKWGLLDGILEIEHVPALGSILHFLRRQPCNDFLLNCHNLLAIGVQTVDLSQLESLRHGVRNKSLQVVLGNLVLRLR